MKKVVLSLFCVVITISVVNAQDRSMPGGVKTAPSAVATKQAGAPAAATAQVVDPDAGKFKFKEETHDYGEVPEGPMAEFDFEFKNVGKKPIVISEAHGSCGCTVPKWPTDPILPKHKAVIHVSYNTAGRVGMINKDVFITSNAVQNPMKLHITGTVKPKPVEANPPPPPAPVK